VGECNYYVKARFNHPKDAEIARGQLTALLTEGEKAYEYWQSCRAFRPTGAPPMPSADEFWAHFRATFPLTTAYLGDVAGVDDYNNGLAGLLGCLVDPAGGQASLECYDGMLEIVLRNIWHFSKMHLLERYLRQTCGAVAAGSVSEEDFDLPEDSSADDWEDGWFFDAIEV
jgi:hypothetical protein